MARQFKPVRVYVMMGMAAFLVCGVTAFFTHRAEQGRTPAERAGYVLGEKAGEAAAPAAKLPTAAGLHMMAEDSFKRQGSGEPMAWKHGFARGYEEGFKKTHRTP